MPDVKAAYHGLLVEKWQVINCPGNTTSFSADLRENLGSD